MAARNYVFTENNPSTNQPSWPECIKYASWQLERGADGTPHLQGYIELSSSRKLAFVKAILPRAHWEIRRGTQAQAREYSRKEDTRIDGPWEHGTYEPHLPGKRSDLLAVKDAIDTGMSEPDLWETHFGDMCRYHKAFNEYKRAKHEDRNWPTRVYLVIGPPGCGKTRYCARNAPTAYWKSRTGNDNQWWDGYDGHSDVVIDEFYGWIRYDTLLRLIDRYPLLVECKGGTRKFVARRIFITSNRDWRDWYPNIGDMGALERRINEFGVRVIDFNENLINPIP